jgi:putative ABC transport system permease protein
MNTVALAWRNLLRNRRRSLMTLLAMVLGLVAVLLFGGYVIDIRYSLQSEFVRRVGHLQIQHKDYYALGSGNPTAYGVANYERVIDLVRSDPVLAPLINTVTPLLQAGGLAGNYAKGVSRTVLVHGTVVEDQNRMREWNEYGQRILTPPLSLAGTAPDSAVIGAGVARVLQLCNVLDVSDCVGEAGADEPAGERMPQDLAGLTAAAPAQSKDGPEGQPRIEILASSGRGAPNVASVNVLRAEFQGVKEWDDVYVGLHLAQAQRLVYGSGQPQVSAVVVQLHHTADMPLALARVQELLRSALQNEPLVALDFATLNP